MSVQVKIEFTDNTVEIKDAETFNLVAKYFEVPVGERGRKPKGELARAVLAKGFTIADTDYFKASHAEDSKPVVRSGRVFESKDDLLAALDELTYPVSVREVTVDSGPKTGVHEVSAQVAIIKAGAVQLTKQNKIRRVPRKVKLTNEEVRALESVGERGRLSESQIVRAAAEKLLPAEFVDQYAELLTNVKVSTNV